MNIYSSENFHFVKEIFPNGFTLRDFEEDFFQNQNILNDDRNIIKVMKLGEVETVIKSFKTPNLFQAIIYKFFRKSKAKRSFENSKLLKGRGVNVPEPLGYIEVFDRYRLRQCYFISSKLNFNFTLDAATDKKIDGYKDILSDFIHFTYDLHKKNIMHLDYGVGNICIKKTRNGYDFYLIDLNRLKEGIVSPKKGIKNLARISNDPEIVKIFADAYAKKISSSALKTHKELKKFVYQVGQRVKLKKLLKSFIENIKHVPLSSYEWDYHSNQPHTLKSKKLKNKIFFLAFFSNLKIIFATLYACVVAPYFFLRDKESFEKKIDSFGLCVNIDRPIESQKSISNIELIAMIDELSVENILVRIPLADFENIENYISFIEQLKDKDVLVCVLQDRKHVIDKHLTKKRLDFIFSKLEGIAEVFQIGNSINRKKWAFLSMDEYFSFFKIAYDLKKNKFPKIKLLGSNIIDFDIPFFSRSVFHLKSIFYDGIAAQLYVDRRGGPEQKQYGFDTLNKIRAYKAMARASKKTSNEMYITEVNWPLNGMKNWAPAENFLIDESLQSSYLVRYYLLMLATGKVKKCFWHQLVAPGYGLVNNLDEKIKKRDAYYCFQNLIAMLSGGITKKMTREKNLFCLIVEKEERLIEAIWSSKGIANFKSNPNQEIFDIRGNAIDTKSSPVINISGEVIYVINQRENYQETNIKLISETITTG
ncbi:MAG: hypothetical protein CM15mP123_08480 [Gammaproteobacteria bacterium]|nr:MAG: hypothetical protein CM15mP123_08480 [Gammaproteobacteria bacterium]